jgi:hypothetical protein
MGRMSRNKGKRGEREIVNELQEIVDDVCRALGTKRITLERNLLQAHSGGCDLFGLHWLSLEVKRQETPAVESWWRQTLEQCARHQTPVLVWRQNHQPWRVRMWGEIRTCAPKTEIGSRGRHIPLIVEMDFEMFKKWFRERLSWELQFGEPAPNLVCNAGNEVVEDRQENKTPRKEQERKVVEQKERKRREIVRETSEQIIRKPWE